jgi:hypothetical protein
MLNFMEARYEKILIDRSKGVLYNVPSTVLTESRNRIGSMDILSTFYYAFGLY